MLLPTLLVLCSGTKAKPKVPVVREEGRTPASEEHVEQPACSELSTLPSSHLNTPTVLWNAEGGAYGNN